MLRKLIIGAIVCNFMFMLLSVISTTDNSLVAQTTTINGAAYATVPQVLELVSGGIREIPADAPSDANPWDYPAVTEMNFGQLTYNSTLGYMTGDYSYTTLMIPVTSGRPYRVTVTGGPITGPGNFTKNALLNIPDYQYLDEFVYGNTAVAQGAMPAGAFCGPVSSVVGTNTVYEDGGAEGEARIVRGIVAISGPPVGESYPVNYSRGHNGATPDPSGTKQEFTAWEPLTIDTRDGDYQCDITYTLNLI